MSGEYGEEPKEMKKMRLLEELEDLFLECVRENMDTDSDSSFGFLLIHGDAAQSLLAELHVLDPESFLADVEKALQNSAAGKGLTELITSWTLRRIGLVSGYTKKPELN